MGYVAVKGGETAIKNSEAYYLSLLDINADRAAVKRAFSGFIDKIMSEGSLYSEKLAAEAAVKSGGEPLNAAFYLRAHRSTCKRAGECQTLSLENIRIVRRISSAFKDIPGGQILGPSGDYVLRLMTDLKISSDAEEPQVFEPIKNRYLPSAVDTVRNWGYTANVKCEETEPFDITRTNPVPPYKRSAAMQIMSRGETGAMLAIAYTTMRGYGDIHPTVGDLRLGFSDIMFTHPLTGKSVKIGEIKVTSCEMVSVTRETAESGTDTLTYGVGYGFCFGFNETKAICMGILDNAMNSRSHSTGGISIASDPEMVLNHIDGIESYGFCNHYKLPHYVTFQADLNLVRAGHIRAAGEK